MNHDNQEKPVQFDIGDIVSMACPFIIAGVMITKLSCDGQKQEAYERGVRDGQAQYAQRYAEQPLHPNLLRSRADCPDWSHAKDEFPNGYVEESK